MGAMLPRPLREMMLWMYRKIGFLFTCTLPFFLSGCSNQSVYSNVTTDITQQNIMSQSSGGRGFSASNWLLMVNRVKLYAPFVIAGSISLGLVLAIITYNAKSVRKRMIGVFIIVIPIITILFVYGISAMWGKLFS